MANGSSDHSASVELYDSFSSSPFTSIIQSDWEKLRRIAAMLLRRYASVTITPQSLLQEAIVSVLKWAKGREITKEHFLRAIAAALPHRLNDELKKKKSLKHGRDFKRATDPPEAYLVEADGLNIDEQIDLNDALLELAKWDHRAALAVQLVRFAGCTLEEAAEEMNKVSPRTVQRDLRMVDAWIASRARKHKGNEA